MLKHVLAALLLVCAIPAHAQTTVVTQPLSVSNNPVPSSSVVSSGTFQSVFPADTNTRGRASCTIQNTGANTLYVFFGPIANATRAKSVQLTTGQPAYCATTNGGVIKDQVSVDGTTAGTFYAAVQ
jgi:hypothetical protein